MNLKAGSTVRTLDPDGVELSGNVLSRYTSWSGPFSHHYPWLGTGVALIAHRRVLDWADQVLTGRVSRASEYFARVHRARVWMLYLVFREDRVSTCGGRATSTLRPG